MGHWSMGHWIKIGKLQDFKQDTLITESLSININIFMILLNAFCVKENSNGTDIESTTLMLER